MSRPRPDVRPRPDIPTPTAIQRMRLEAGDVLIVSYGRALSSEQAADIKKRLLERLRRDDIQIVIMDSGPTLSVVAR